MKSLTVNTKLILALGLLLLAAVATAIGCSWPGTSHSVRFNAYQTEREMARLPPLPTMANGMTEMKAFWYLEEEGDFYERSDKQQKEVESLWHRAEAAEQDGNLRLDRELLNSYLKYTQLARDWPATYTARQERRSSAI